MGIPVCRDRRVQPKQSRQRIRPRSEVRSAYSGEHQRARAESEKSTRAALTRHQAIVIGLRCRPEDPPAVTATQYPRIRHQSMHLHLRTALSTIRRNPKENTALFLYSNSSIRRCTAIVSARPRTVSNVASRKKMNVCHTTLKTF